MKTLVAKTINELVEETPSLIEYFENTGIDYCCAGGLSLEEAIAQKQMNEKEVIEAIYKIQREFDNTDAASQQIIDVAYLSLSSLIQYIIDKHHGYTRATLEELEILTAKIANVHGNSRPELLELRNIFVHLRGELTKHLQKEELFVFPHLLSMERKATGEFKNDQPLKNVDELWQSIGEEHLDTGAVLEQIQGLTNNFTPPPEACNSYKKTYSLLKQLTRDIHMHVRLEEHILLNKARSTHEQIQ